MGAKVVLVLVPSTEATPLRTNNERTFTFMWLYFAIPVPTTNNQQPTVLPGTWYQTIFVNDTTSTDVDVATEQQPLLLLPPLFLMDGERPMVVCWLMRWWRDNSTPVQCSMEVKFLGQQAYLQVHAGAVGLFSLVYPIIAINHDAACTRVHHQFTNHHLVPGTSTTLPFPCVFCIASHTVSYTTNRRRL